jgi:hypothetical protein
MRAVQHQGYGHGEEREGDGCEFGTVPPQGATDGYGSGLG